MKEEGGFIKWFSELSNKDVPIAGGKGASLAEMYNAKVPVPPGFVVTAQSYSYFLQKTHTIEKIKKVLSTLNVDDTESLNKASKEIRFLIEAAVLPQEMQNEIVEAYEILGARADSTNLLHDSGGEIFVAVRSSATTEDLADASFAGQQDTFLNVKGPDSLLLNVKKCMSSLFTPRAIFYREKKGFPHEKSYLAVVVQKMVDSVKSGVMFSRNPTTSENNIVIEAVWGLGEGIVSGQIKPDHYVVSPDLDNFEISEIKISEKKTAIIKNAEGKNETIQLNKEQRTKRVLDNYEIKRLAQYAKQLEDHYKKPQDIEFAVDKNTIFIVQSRPITTQFKESKEKVSGKEVLTGLGASPGISSGTVKIIHDLKELEKVQEGDILVTEMTNPDMVVSMQKSAAIVTDEGGVTSHAAIVSREMGIPCVVGTGDATKKLKDGDVITVDGSAGKVYAGKGETKLVEVLPVVPTRTEIKVIIDIPEYAERAAKSKVRAIGLTRLEGIIAAGGIHPIKFVNDKKIPAYIKLISEGVKKIVAPFQEICVRTSDIRSDEYRNLQGAPQQVEGNPMLGDHGVRFSIKHKDIMRAELAGIINVAKELPNKKFGVMVPQVISVSEVRETKKLAEEIGLPKNVKIGIMVETPAAVQIIEDLCKEGISFISFGTNDLTQFTLAIDRNNESVQDIYDETHPAILRSLAQVIIVCKRYGVKTSICGQAGSRPEMAKYLVGLGIDSISVNADAAKKVSEIVAEIENSKTHSNNHSEQPEFYQQKNSQKQNSSAQKSHEEKDIEEIVLKALDGENDYNSGSSHSPNEEIPSVYDSMSGEEHSPTADFLAQIPQEDVESAVFEELKRDARRTNFRQ